MRPNGWHGWNVTAWLSVLVVFTAGCALSWAPGHATWLESSCGSEEPELLASISPIVDLGLNDQSIFLITRGSPGSVLRISTSDGDFRILSELTDEPYGFLVDEKWIYWVEGSWKPEPGFTLMRLDQRGGDTSVLWHSAGSMLYLSMDDEHIYWMESETSSIWRMLKKGSTPEQLTSGIPDLSNFFIQDETAYLSGRNGLQVLSPGDPYPEKVVGSDQLLQVLNIGLRDEYSAYSVGPVLAVTNDMIYFSFYVSNYPGMISCTDNAAYILSISKNGGNPKILLTVEGGLIAFAYMAPYLYTIGNCWGGQMVNMETGEVTLTEIGYDAFTMAIDHDFLFWSDREGLKCIFRRGE